MRVYNGSSGTDYFGPGGNYVYPLSNRAMKIVNNTGYDLFVPQNSQAETNDVYYNISQVSGVSAYYGNYIDNWGSLRGDTWGPFYACWSPGSNPFSSDGDMTPPGCPAGFYNPSGVYYYQNTQIYDGGSWWGTSSVPWVEGPPGFFSGEPNLTYTDSYGHVTTYSYPNTDVTNDIYWQRRAYLASDSGEIDVGQFNYVGHGVWGNPYYGWSAATAKTFINGCSAGYPYSQKTLRICKG